MNNAKSLFRYSGFAALALIFFTVSAFAGGKIKPAGISFGNDNRDDGGSTGPESGQVTSCGDMNGDAVVDILDLDFFIDFYFNFGPAPVSAGIADLNCDANDDIADIVFLASYLNGSVTSICCGGYGGNNDDGTGPKDKEKNTSDKNGP